MNSQHLVSLINSKGLACTKSRLKILDICITAKEPVDVAYVEKKLSKDMHLATIYRILEKFVSAGILERIDFQEGKFRYEFMHDHHHHLVCQSCGIVKDITDDSIENIQSMVSQKTGFTITKHIFELFGLCANCTKKGAYV